MNAATQQQLAALGGTSAERTGQLPENAKLAFLKGKLDGYTQGREMKLVSEQQRSGLLAALERVLAADDLDTAHALARAAIDSVSRETTAVIEGGR